MRRRLIVHALIAALALESTPGLASAQDPTTCVDSLEDAQIAHRLRWIETRFERHKRHGRAWYFGWLSFAVVAGGFSWARFALADHSDGITRDSQFLSGLGSIALVGTMSGMSMTSAFASRRLARLSRDTPEDRRVALVEATRLLRLAARRQRPATRVISHVAPGIWASITGTYLLTRYHDQVSTSKLVLPVGIAYAFPLIVAEARIWSQPTSAIRDYERYRGFACTGGYMPTPEEERDPLAEDDLPADTEIEETPVEERDPEPESSTDYDTDVQLGFGPTNVLLRVQF